MSPYPWIQKHKRYLSFRYIFPKETAVWIQLLRGLLRIRWFFTHPIDEFLDDLKELVLWPIAVCHQLWRWTVNGVVEFLKDLLHGISAAVRWVGRFQVWTGAALFGVIGIILTLLLFLQPMAGTKPVTAAITTEPVIKANTIIQPLFPGESQARSVPPPREPEFDPFAKSPVSNVPRPGWESPQLMVDLDRLALPWGWDSLRMINVASVTSPLSQSGLRPGFARNSLRDGWTPWQRDRLSAASDFSPYVSRIGSRSPRVTPGWDSPEDTVGSFAGADSLRQPFVIVEKRAPRTALVGQPLQYTLVVRNLGDETLPSVKVRERVSAIERVSNVHPSASVVGDTLVWDVTDLRPGGQQLMRVELQPDTPMTLAQNSVVEVTTAVAATSTARHPRPDPPATPPSPAVTQPEPERFPEQEEGPPTMILPFETTVPVEPLRPVKEPATQVRPPDFDPWEDEPTAGPPPQHEPLLPAGEPPSDVFLPEPKSRPISYTDALSLDMITPPAVSSGHNVRTIFELHNDSESEQTGIVLAVELSDELQHQHGRTLELRIDRLAAGETYRTRLTARAVKEGTARLSSRLTSQQSRETAARRDVRISHDVAPPADIVFEVPASCPPYPCRSRLF